MMKEFTQNLVCKNTNCSNLAFPSLHEWKVWRHLSWHSQERHSKRPRGSPQRKIPIVTMRRVFKRLILRYDLCSSPRTRKIVLLSVRSGTLTIRISFVNL